MTHPSEIDALTVVMAHPGSELYGSDRVFLESARQLKIHGWKVVAALPEDGPLAERLRSEGVCVRFRSTPVIRKSAMSPIGLLKLAKEALCSLPGSISLLRSVRPGVLYVSTLVIPFWIIIGRMLGLRVVCHVHEAETGASALVRRLLAGPVVLATQVIFNSHFCRSVLLESFPSLARRSTVILNPLEGPPIQTVPRNAIAAHPELLFLGRISPRKGPDVAIKALAEIRSAGFDARLSLLGSVFAGYEWFREDLSTLVTQLGLEDQISFLGFESDVWPTIASCDVVLIPSIADESFGNAAVEAVLARRPVVVAASGGLLEAVEGYSSARTAAVGDEAELARQVIQLIEDWQEVTAATASDAAAAAERHSFVHYGELLASALESVAIR